MSIQLITTPFIAFTGMFQDPANRWFSLYLATSLLIAWTVYGIQSRHDAEVRALGLIGFVFPNEVYWHPSARLDYRFYVVNKICFMGLFASAALSANEVASITARELASIFEGLQVPQYPGFALLVTTLLYLLTFDFGLWLAHYLAHRIPFLWEFHKVHHSVEVLTPFSAGRVHPVDDLMSYVIGGVLSGGALGFCQAIFGEHAIMLGAFQLHVVVFLFYVTGFHLRHSHAWLPYTGWLGHILISPAHHQLHHSSEARHWDRNMGFIFAFWDWMFGTLYVPSQEREVFRLGIGGEEKEFNTVGRLYWLPLQKAGRRLTTRAAAVRDRAMARGAKVDEATRTVGSS